MSVVIGLTMEKRRLEWKIQIVYRIGINTR